MKVAVVFHAADSECGKSKAALLLPFPQAAPEGFCCLVKPRSLPKMGLSLQVPSRERIEPEPLEILHSDGFSTAQLPLAQQPWHNGLQQPQVINQSIN